MSIISQEEASLSIGVMGGMFDPIHNGHLSTAIAALKEFKFDELRLVPCGQPVHRQSSTIADDDRIEMLNLAAGQAANLIVDKRECKRSEPSFTIDTLKSLRKDKPQACLFLLLGVDAFNTLTSWHQWQDIFQEAHIIVITRPGWVIDINAELQNFIKARTVSSFSDLGDLESRAGKVLIKSFTPLLISSSQVRNLIKDNKTAAHLVPDTVWSYIKAHKLYAKAGVGN